MQNESIVMQEMQVSQRSTGFTHVWFLAAEESLRRFSTKYTKLHTTKSTLIFSKCPN